MNAPPSYPHTLFFLVLLIITSGKLSAVISLASPSSEWVPVLYLGVSDPADDQQTSTGGGEADIVGDETNAALFKLYDSESDQMAFRLRLGGDDRPMGFTSAAIIAFDVGADGVLDGYIGVQKNGVGDLSGNTKRDIGIYTFTGTADTPNNTQSVLASPSDALYAYEETGLNFSWKSVESIDGDNDDDSTTPVDLDGFGREDYFLSFAVSFTDLAATLSIDPGTTLGFVAITSQNLNQINNDYNGIDNNDPNFDPDAPWNDPNQPVVSQSYTAESLSPVPEVSGYGLWLGLVLLTGALLRRQR